MILADFTDPKNPKIQIKSSRQILKEREMNRKSLLSYQQLGKAIEIIEDFMEEEGLEFWETRIKGDNFKPVRWVSKDVLQRILKEQ